MGGTVFAKTVSNVSNVRKAEKAFSPPRKARGRREKEIGDNARACQQQRSAPLDFREEKVVLSEELRVSEDEGRSCWAQPQVARCDFR